MENNRIMGVILTIGRADGTYFCSTGYTLHTGAIYRYWWSVEYKTEYKYIDKILQPKGFYQN